MVREVDSREEMVNGVEVKPQVLGRAQEGAVDAPVGGRVELRLTPVACG